MKQKPFNIHFVCRGNTYRSRLAAAYMATLTDTRFSISSSGIGTKLTPVQTIELFTRATAQHNRLEYGLSQHKTQTTDKLLTMADIIVFMNKDIYDEALKTYTFDTRKTVVWHVKDIDNTVKRRVLAQHSKQALIDASAHTYDEIRHHCNELWTYLTQTSWTDIVEADNHSTGFRLPVNWAADRGLWHRGVHVVVQTTDGKFVVGKRSKSIIFSPQMLEITLGGGMDAGETPLQGAIRETHEELGVRLAPGYFRPLFVQKYSNYHPHYRKYTRVHVYVYAVTLPVHSSRLTPQPEEVDEIRVLTKRQVKLLLYTHRMEHFGRLKPAQKLYQRAITHSLTVLS